MRVAHRGICASRDAIFGSHKSFHLLDPSNLVPRLMRSVLVNISLTERQGDRSVRKNGHLRGTGRGIYLGLEIIFKENWCPPHREAALNHDYRRVKDLLGRRLEKFELIFQ